MFTTSLTYLEQAGHGKAAFRILPDAREDRTATHFIGLLDVSDSMGDANKLTHVKHCMSLLLKFLTPADELSLVTFGETSSILLRRIRAEPAVLPTAEERIQRLTTEGCTNLSAGLASVREILDEVAAAGSTLKQGLLVLTDGHANRGVSDPTALRTMISGLLERYPALSFSFVAYGTDHNSGLLKTAAEDTHGSYSIVEDLEGAALSMGEALGGMISCVAQNVTVEFPVGTKGSGPHKIGAADGKLVLGDLYAGSEVMVLVDIPAPAADSVNTPVRVRGSALPSLDPFNVEVTDCPLSTERNLAIELTRLRYQCADLFRRIRELRGGVATAALRTDVENFRTAVLSSDYDGNPIAEMLRQEVPSLEEAVRMVEAYGGVNSNRLVTQLLQHEAYTALGRGTSQPIAPPPAPRYNNVRWAEDTLAAGYGTDPDEDDQDPDATPGAPRVRGSLPLAPSAAADSTPSYLSPTASTGARRVAMAMRVSSSSAAPPRPRLSPVPATPADGAGTPPASPQPAPLGRASSCPT